MINFGHHHLLGMLLYLKLQPLMIDFFIPGKHVGIILLFTRMGRELVLCCQVVAFPPSQLVFPPHFLDIVAEVIAL